MRTRGLVLALWLACSTALAGEIDCDATTGFDVLDAFDSDAEISRRQHALEGLKTYAQCPEFGYSLGLLYRHGAELPGNLLPKDLQQAQQLLLHSAEAGNLLAYADLAEMALKEEQPREAMKWTQVYLYFLQAREKFDARRGSHDRSGYGAHLLSRAEGAWRNAVPELRREWVGEDLNAYLRGKKQITNAIDARDAEASRRETGGMPQEELQVKQVERCHARPRWPGYATYLVEVRPDGTTGRVVLENFSPKAGIGKDLIGCAGVYVYHPFPGTESQVARIPVLVGGGGSVRIKAKRD